MNKRFVISVVIDEKEYIRRAVWAFDWKSALFVDFLTDNDINEINKQCDNTTNICICVEDN
jgi:hypothetical protein